MVLEIYILQRIKQQSMKAIRMSPFLMAVCYLLMAAGCKKDNPQSELVTVNGQTFGCRVNGKPFIADKWDFGNNIPPIRIRFRYSPVLQTNTLQVLAEKENQLIELWVNSPVTVGIKNLISNTLSHPTIVNPLDYGSYETFSPFREYITNNIAGGHINILVADTINQKVEGTFEFTGTDRTTGEKVTVTNGYFKKF